jgi:peptidoglycan/LPS O-acetylase OafA/YrhL
LDLLMSDRIPILNGLRAISILFVLASHLLPLGPKAWRLNETVATLGMTIFFSLSGFLIASQLLHDEDVLSFLVRRVARIWPLILAYTFFIYVILDPDFKKFIFTNLFVINYLTQYMDNENGHLWSLCVEIQFYLSIALAVAIGGRRAVYLAWPACLIITALRVCFGARIDNMTHLRVDEILVGCCLAGTYQYWNAGFRTKTARLLLAGILTLGSCWPFGGPMQYFRPYFTALLFISTVTLSTSSFAYPMLCSRPLSYVAEISYSLYVIHPLLTHGWFEGQSMLEKYAIKRPLSLLLTFILAHVSTFYWERPFIRLAKRMTQAPISPPVVKTG